MTPDKDTFELLNLLWAVVVIPLGWLGKVAMAWVKSVNESIRELRQRPAGITEEQVKEIVAEEHKDIRSEFNSVRDDIAGLRKDFSTQMDTLNKSNASIGENLHQLMLKLLEPIR